MEVEIQRKNRLVQGLFCNCRSNSEISRNIRSNLELSNFANAIGGQLYLSANDQKLLDVLRSTHADYLPGGKYELAFKGEAKEYMEGVLRLSLDRLNYRDNDTIIADLRKPTPSSDETSEISVVKRQDAYGQDAYRDSHFLCKECCPICANASRGCSIHDCATCWVNITKLYHVAEFARSQTILTPRVTKLKKSTIDAFVNSVIKNPNIPNGKLLTPSTGYLHNSMDIVLYLYNKYEIESELCHKLIEYSISL